MRKKLIFSQSINNFRNFRSFGVSPDQDAPIAKRIFEIEQEFAEKSRHNANDNDNYNIKWSRRF
jgi:hypothetical protein